MKALARMMTPLLLALITTPTAFAQDDGVPKLFQARSVRCEWGRGTQANWDTGTLSLKQGTFGKDAIVTFDSIDAQQRTARIVANAGANDVVVIPTPEGLTFFERTALGSVNVTTIFAKGVGPANQLVGVTSRHLTLGGPFPSQWHGTCRILQWWRSKCERNLQRVCSSSLR